MYSFDHYPANIAGCVIVAFSLIYKLLSLIGIIGYAELNKINFDHKIWLNFVLVILAIIYANFMIF